MSYQAFAKIYDHLMKDAPYHLWIHYVKECFNQDLQGVKILDVGCGTGELLLSLVEEGADVSGVDISSEMLAVAREKCEQVGISLNLYEQSMTNLEGLDTFDAVTIFCDSLNYLKTKEDVQNTFKRVYQCLKKDGFLLFDVHSVNKIEHGFIDQTFADDLDEVAYIWTSFAGEYPISVEHELTFFVRSDSDDPSYFKVEELHKQRTFSIADYEQWLKEAGFEVQKVTADFTNQPPTETSERIFFCARKKD